MGTLHDATPGTGRLTALRASALAGALAFALASNGAAQAAPHGPPPPPPAPAAAAAAASTGGGLPPAGDAATDLAAAEKFYADLDYDRANLVAARVSAGKGLTHSELVRALRILSLTDAALGHEDQAREEFIELLTYAADFQVDPNLGPRVTAPFLEARGYWRARSEKPGVEVTPSVHADGPGTLRVIVRDPTHIVKTGSVGFRWGTSVPYIVAPLAVTGSGDGAVFDVPERPGNVTRLDYYAQVFDDRGNAVMEVGNPVAPKSSVVDIPKVVVVPPPPAKSIFASPIFWTVAGVVVAGAATTTYLLTRPKDATGSTLVGAAVCGSAGSAVPCH